MLILSDNEIELLQIILDEFQNLHDASLENKPWILNPLPSQESYEDVIELCRYLEYYRKKRRAEAQLTKQKLLFEKPSPEIKEPERD
jgi:hypothetical protein